MTDLLSVAEERRLAVLRRYGILDTAPEPVFDQLAEAAAALADMPVALVSLVDEDRQWFKARVGMSVCETGRDVAFCDHVVRDSAEMVVTDASTDARFAHNRLVIDEPGIRFYAGLPLRSPEGMVLGTLCVMDYKPRQLGDAQMLALRALAGQVMSQLELRASLAREQQARDELQAAQRRLEMAQDLAGIATWSWDVLDGSISWSPRMRALFEASESVEPSFGYMICMVHPADRPSFCAAYGRLLADGQPVTLDHRILLPGGTHRWIRTWAVAELNAEGQVVRVDSSGQEITEHREREAALVEEASLDPLTGLVNRRGWVEATRAVLDTARNRPSPTAVAIMDLDHFKRVNDTLGHDAGDRLLVDCTAAWRSVLRAGDVLARLGGEEFALLLPRCDPATATGLLDRLSVATPGSTTFSAGLTELRPGEDLADAVARADQALYEAKARGRNQVVEA